MENPADQAELFVNLAGSGFFENQRFGPRIYGLLEFRYTTDSHRMLTPPKRD